MEDTQTVDFHYVQDSTLLNLRKKAMNANPSIYVGRLGDLLNKVLQLAGLIYILLLLSPLIIVLLAVTGVVSVYLMFKDKKAAYVLQNSSVEEERKMEYLYKAMTEYRFAKEARINNGGSFLARKYKSTAKWRVERIKAYYRTVTGIGIANVLITTIQSVIMYFYFSYQAYTQTITIAEYTVLLGAATLFASTVLAFFDNVATIKNVYLKNIDDYYAYQDLVKNNSTAYRSNNLPAVAPKLSETTIKFEDVSFKYPDAEKYVLNM